jgi:muramoyltetrapeptide carboxypeptidase
MIPAPYLKKGDKIAITCPAKALKTPLTDAIKLLESWELEVVLGKTIDAEFHQFAGTDELRTQDFQQFIDDDSIKAIIAARGGYGCIRIVDTINWKPLLKQPKWIIGFSDITIFHLQLQSLGLQSIHGQMPSTIPDSTSAGILSLEQALFGEKISYQIPQHPFNKAGKGKGVLIGGNLSLIAASVGSNHDFDFSNHILFIEDVGEYPYIIDRMVRTLDRAGKLKNLAGLIVGGFTNMKVNDIPFGYSTIEIIKLVTQKYDFPICYNFPAGHLPNNLSLVFGGEVKLEVSDNEVSLIQL